MATRPVFAVKEAAPFFNTISVDFTWNSGFSKTQKQKNIQAIHTAYKSSYPGKEVLEISSKSMQAGGEALSAFYLPKYVPSLGKSVPVECVFQAGKVFTGGGPYLDLLEKTPREAKRDERLQTSGRLIAFEFDGKRFPINPTTVFYDYIYINALLENKNLAETALAYDAFTDIEFNPERSLNCQAKAAATYVSLCKMNLIEQTKNFEDFLALYSMPQRPAAMNIVENKPEIKAETPEILPGSVITHPAWGIGEVKKQVDTILTVSFPSVGLKEINTIWCVKNCEIKPK